MNKIKIALSKYLLTLAALLTLPIIIFTFILFIDMPIWAAVIATVCDVLFYGFLVKAAIKVTDFINKKPGEKRAFKPVLQDATLKECLNELSFERMGNDTALIFVAQGVSWPCIYSLNDLIELLKKRKEPSSVTEKIFFANKDRNIFSLLDDGIYPTIVEQPEVFGDGVND